MKLVIDIPEDVYKRTVFYREFKDLNDCVTTIKALENGTPFDRVLEIIDNTKQAFIEDGIEGEAVAVEHAIDRIKELRSEVLSL